MSVILVFLLVVAGIAAWWLSHQRLMSKPWLEQGISAALPENDVTGMPTAKVGLGVFLAVVGALFALFASAFFMRMDLSDWQAPPVPQLVWLNTGVLALSSVALHCAVLAARKGDVGTTKLALVAGGLTALAFLLGQLLAWRELSATGYFLRTNPANGFFYLLTGVHGLHIVGGLAALARTTARTWSGPANEKLRLGVELCAMYWHFLLLIWFAIVILLAGWASDFIDICRQLLN